MATTTQPARRHTTIPRDPACGYAVPLELGAIPLLVYRRDRRLFVRGFDREVFGLVLGLS